MEIDMELKRRSETTEQDTTKQKMTLSFKADEGLKISLTVSGKVKQVEEFMKENKINPKHPLLTLELSDSQTELDDYNEDKKAKEKKE